MFPVNQVFQLGEKRLRLLWTGKDTAFWIDIDDSKAWPQSIALEDIELQLISRDLTRIEDPCIESTLREVEEGSVHWDKRENAWAVIKDEIGNPELFCSRERGKAVRRIMERNGITHQTANRLIRRYWQRGMCKNALLPDYNKSGGAGKKRKPSDKKLGRRLHVFSDGTPRDYLLAKFRLKDGQVRYVLEVDTSDRESLSTKVFGVALGIKHTDALEKILGMTVKKSLHWPDKTFFNKYCVICAEVAHPRSANNVVVKSFWPHRCSYSSNVSPIH